MNCMTTFLNYIACCFCLTFTPTTPAEVPRQYKSFSMNGKELGEIETIGNWKETELVSAIDEQLYKNEGRDLSEAKMTTVRQNLACTLLIQNNYLI